MKSKITLEEWETVDSKWMKLWEVGGKKYEGRKTVLQTSAEKVIGGEMDGRSIEMKERHDEKLDEVERRYEKQVRELKHQVDSERLMVENTECHGLDMERTLVEVQSRWRGENAKMLEADGKARLAASQLAEAELEKARVAEEGKEKIKGLKAKWLAAEERATVLEEKTRMLEAKWMEMEEQESGDRQGHCVGLEGGFGSGKGSPGREADRGCATGVSRSIRRAPTA